MELLKKMSPEDMKGKDFREVILETFGIEDFSTLSQDAKDIFEKAFRLFMRASDLHSDMMLKNSLLGTIAKTLDQRVKDLKAENQKLEAEITRLKGLH